MATSATSPKTISLAADVLTSGARACIKVATCNLNQWAMDFDGNLERVKDSIIECKKRGCVLRVGPELEITGYGCQDHFLEQDTFMHAWQSLANIIESNITENILCSIGMPIFHKSAAYNCSIWMLNSKIILIRPKMFLANDGNYREMRYFSGWNNISKMDQYVLPPMIQKLTNQYNVPIGPAIIETQDTSLATLSTVNTIIIYVLSLSQLFVCFFLNCLLLVFLICFDFVCVFVFSIILARNNV